MASASMAIPLMSATQNRLNQSNSASLFKSVPVRPSKEAAFVKPKSKGMLKVEASFKEKAVTGLTAAALTASMVIPEELLLGSLTSTQLREPEGEQFPQPVA
ncbi:hypothetical protein L3X38_007060 [Prunus dulcis]|uniref:Uncharacterized protein n=1 Tax=Prunus dulcis TaxID=3755 RepID=A0AAD4ZTY6_PRUDU|nr:hypothetical protein L3X38_007060 [Prunus dulcis]